MDSGFRYRGEEPGRLENFSDAVFALAITLLLISTNAPGNFEQIKRFAWEIIPFCICIALIILIWHQHFVFYFRYGLRNGRVLLMNTVFLIIVLFYVYPLKFLFRLILYPVALLFDQPELIEELNGIYKGTNMVYLMVIYGIGAASVFAVLMLMYRYALNNRIALQLNDLETFDTRISMYTNFFMGVIPLLSVFVALCTQHVRLGGLYAGLTYFLYLPAMFGFKGYARRKRKKLIGLHQPTVVP